MNNDSFEEIKKNFVEKLKKDLSENYHEENDDILNDYFNLYLQIASNSSNRAVSDEKILPYVYTAIKSTFIRRGDEGKSSSSEGGLSSSYIDIEDKLRKDIREIRLLP